MNPEHLHYWRRGISFDRNHIIPNKVAVETIRLLMAYTQVHKNVRAGVYLNNSGFSKFYTLKQVIDNFDLFHEVASSGKSFLADNYPPEIKAAFGPTFSNQIEDVWLLKWPLYIEHESIDWLKNIAGYNFKRPFRIKIHPKDIEYLEAKSLGEFRIGIKNFEIEVVFRNQISVR